MKQLTTLLLFVFTVHLAQSQNFWNSKKVRGNGKSITKIRSIGGFESVSVSGNFDVILINGKEGKLTIDGEENIIPYIITKVKRGTLKIKVKENVNIKTTKKLVIKVPFEDIDGISLGGSGNVISKKIIKATKASFSMSGSGNIEAKADANKVNCSISGSGDIDIQGFTTNLNCSITGSGKINAYKLKTNSVTASIAGSGDVYTSVKTRIKANIVGSGSIYYKGNPKYIDTKSLGSGDVIDRN